MSCRDVIENTDVLIILNFISYQVFAQSAHTMPAHVGTYAAVYDQMNIPNSVRFS